MSRADGILHLVLERLPWEEIEADRKPVEYRDPERPKWAHLLEDIQAGVFHSVRLQLGFHKDPLTGKVPTVLRRIASADSGPADPLWVYGILPGGKILTRIWIGERVA